jgi:Tol biopolymer transport system component
MDRRGSALGAIGDPQTNDIGSPELSPDEQSVAVFLHPARGADNDVWVIELARNFGRPITSGPPADAHPFWDPDGEHVVFNSARAGARGPTRFPMRGGSPQLVFDAPQEGLALAWTRDRRFMLLRRDGGKTGLDLFALPATGDDREIVITQSPGDETEGQFSPDGKWVAFVGNQSGRPEVFVQAFPGGEGRTQVSTAGGTQIRWSLDGTEVFYIAPDGRLMAVRVALGSGSPDVELPVALFQTHLATGINVVGNKAQYAVSRDGRFLLNTAIESASAPIVVAVNWMKKLAN